MSRSFNSIAKFVTLSSLFLLVTVAEGNERLTKYGCEGTTLKIDCQEGTVINLVRANYGRFSISICNDGGNTDWSVNCMEPRTLRVINARCEGKPSCKIPVDSGIFGDPCPGTNKYVEVHYTCQPLRKSQTTTAKILPPWLLDLAATPSSISVTEPGEISTTSTTTTSTTTTTTEIPVFEEKEVVTVQVPVQEPTDDIVIEKHVVDEDEFDYVADDDEYENDAEVDDYDEQVEILEGIVDHCPPRTTRGLFWNWTKIGEDAIKVCPHGSTGFTRWSCGSNGLWTTEVPNMSECQSLWLNMMEQRLISNQGSLERIAMELSASTETRTLYGGDFAVAAKIMQGLAHRLRQELYVMTDQEEKETLAAELMQSVMKTTSNLLDEQHFTAWDDLTARKRSVAATSLMLAIEENSLLLTETINNEKHLAEATNNVFTSMRIMRARGVQDQIFPQEESVLAIEESRLLMPIQTLLDSSVNGAVRIVFFLYSNMERILPGSSPSKVVNSKVIGTIASKGRYLDVSGQPILITLKHLLPTGAGNPSCATWNYSAKSWATDSCSVLKTNDTHTTCQCLKVGNYAVLTDKAPTAEPHESLESDTSFTITIVCVSVLAALLAFGLLAIIATKRFRVKPESLNKLFSTGNGKLPCFHCKKSESQNSCSSTGGLYPALTASPTSTTVSGTGTPMNTTSTSSNYLVQILEQQQETMRTLKAAQACGTLYAPQKAVPQHQKGSVYRVTAPRGTILNHLNDNGFRNGVFRPVSPYNHHIYVEIDPVYSQTADASDPSTQSDVQLSDISDDDLRRFTDTPSGARKYGEERPLIRAAVRQQVNNDNLIGQSLVRARQQPQPRYCVTANGSQLRHAGPLHVANLNDGLGEFDATLRRGQMFNLVHSANPGVASAERAPVAIALQDGEQFVSLQIDQRDPQMLLQ